MTRLALVRAPFSYRYNKVDVREEVILSQLSFYLDEIGVRHDIVDFHLSRDATVDSVLRLDPSAVVIAVRETGDNVHYALRVAQALRRRLRCPIVLYGQTARLRSHPQLPEGVSVVIHSERALAQELGLSPAGPAFGDGLLARPYFDRIALAAWQTSRLRGTLETSRGCPFPCDFCFINSGPNHEQRWQRQDTCATLASLASYTDRGVNAFVFHDSEFIGGARKDIAGREALVDALLAERPDIYFKVYARADTVLRYPRLDRLRDAGLVSVFMGVESFVQSDLDRMKKKLAVGTIHQAIAALADAGIYMDLSFILFNQSTTAATLRENLETILRLYTSEHARLLGMPHFTFSFESTWRSAETRRLSGSTYVDWDLRMKSPAAAGAVFDPGLEPLMEVYRLLAYEWSKKVVSLNLARDDADAAELDGIERWFQGLGAFCVRTMLDYLGQFERGGLRLGRLATARDDLFRRIGDYYQVLPPRLRAPATFQAHAGALAYGAAVELVEADEYWSEQIPDLDVLDGAGGGGLRAPAAAGV